MSKNYTYADAGVNRGQRVEAKKELTNLRETYRHIGFGGIMHLPYSNVLPIGEDRFLDLQIEGVGTKVLIAELADKYDTIGIDAVAMVVNDVIRSGAKPLALADNIHATASVPKLVNAWLKGIIAGAEQSECPVVNGETGDVAEIIKGLKPDSGFDMVVSCVGQVERRDLITGRGITPRDVIIGLANDCEIQMNWDKSNNVGKRHAKLYYDKSKKTPVLLALEPKIIVNNRTEIKKSDRYPLTNGDEFKIGDTVFVYFEKD